MGLTPSQQSKRCRDFSNLPLPWDPYVINELPLSTFHKSMDLLISSILNNNNYQSYFPTLVHLSEEVLTSALQCLSYRWVMRENLFLFMASQRSQRHCISSLPSGQCASHACMYTSFADLKLLHRQHTPLYTALLPAQWYTSPH